MSDLPILERIGIRVSGWRERQRTRCWFFHDWSRWKITLDSNLIRDKMTVGRTVEQRRSCGCCGLTQIKQSQWEI